MEMLKWLDTLTELGSSNIHDKMAKSYPTMTDLDVGRLSGAPLDKFIKKMVSKFDLDPELAPRHLKTKKVAAFRYLVGEKESTKMSESILQVTVTPSA